MTANTEKNYSIVSQLQFPILRDFAALPPGTFVSVSEASKLDQRPFGSLYHRDWIAYRPGKGFYATAKGRQAFDLFTAAEARHRNRPELPLSHYFDPIAYGLNVPSRRSGTTPTKKAPPPANVREFKVRGVA